MLCEVAAVDFTFNMKKNKALLDDFGIITFFQCSSITETMLGLLEATLPALFINNF